MLPKNKKRVIVALDLPSPDQAMELVQQLGNSISFYKIGLALIPIGGFDLAQKLKQAEKKVFLDMKLFDIGQTIEKTIKSINRFDIDFLTVHGDPQIIRAASKANENSNMKILAVTLLTSMNREDLNESLIKEGSLSNLVVQRARTAFLSGADGVIASPKEVKKIRQIKESDGKLIVTPGIRLADGANNDQKRISDPMTAFKNGSDYIVVGRPIYESKDPFEEVKKFQLLSKFKN